MFMKFGGGHLKKFVHLTYLKWNVPHAFGSLLGYGKVPTAVRQLWYLVL